jgi:uncharacterized membrane protein
MPYGRPLDMHFERSIDIDAPQQRAWDVLSALEAWPEHIETVESVDLLTPAPIRKGSRVRLKQPKLPEGTWDITVWDAPSYFEWTQKTGATTSVAGHRVEALGEGRARLTLTLDLRGVLIPIIALFYKDLTNRYMSLEAEGMKRAAESTQEPRTSRDGIRARAADRQRWT